MNRKREIILLSISLTVAIMACSFVSGAIGRENEGDDKISTLEVETATSKPSEKPTPAESQGEKDVESSTAESDNQVSETEIVSEGSASYNTIFPLPGDVRNFMNMGNDSINFQTGLSLNDAIAFYRQAFKTENLIERTVNTAITETTFSMVFDGHSGGVIVIQGVDLGDGTTNINIRFEDV